MRRGKGAQRGLRRSRETGRIEGVQGLGKQGRNNNNNKKQGRSKCPSLCVFWWGWSWGEGPLWSPAKRSSGTGAQKKPEKSIFIQVVRGRTQIARTVRKNENVEATGRCHLIRATFPRTWAKYFLISGRFKSHLAHRHLFWEIKHPQDAICFSREYWMKVPVDHQLRFFLPKLYLTKRHICFKEATDQRFENPFIVFLGTDLWFHLVLLFHCKTYITFCLNVLTRKKQKEKERKFIFLLILIVYHTIKTKL